MAMRNNFLLLGMFAIFSVSCLNTEKENTAKENIQDAEFVQSSQYESYFRIHINGMHSKDSIEVNWWLCERDLLIIYSNKGVDIDSSHIQNVNEINSYEWLFSGYFGIDVTLGCGTGCSIQEYHLYKAENDTLYDVLAFRSYDYTQEASRPVRRNDKGDYIINQHEYVAKFVNISSIDNTVTIFEQQRDNFHDNSMMPQNFSQVYSLKWDSLNHVYCNTYIDLVGEYPYYIVFNDGCGKHVELKEYNVPAFKTKIYTYVFVNKVWAILKENNELQFMQDPNY